MHYRDDDYHVKLTAEVVPCVSEELTPAGISLQGFPYRTNYPCKQIPARKNLQAPAGKDLQGLTDRDNYPCKQKPVRKSLQGGLKGVGVGGCLSTAGRGVGGVAV